MVATSTATMPRRPGFCEIKSPVTCGLSSAHHCADTFRHCHAERDIRVGAVVGERPVFRRMSCLASARQKASAARTGRGFRRTGLWRDRRPDCAMNRAWASPFIQTAAGRSVAWRGIKFDSPRPRSSARPCHQPHVPGRCHQQPHHSAAFIPSIAAAPALMRGMSSLPNSVASLSGSKPRMRKEPIPSR
jgi:hypothetical protein